MVFNFAGKGVQFQTDALFNRAGLTVQFYPAYSIAIRLGQDPVKEPSVLSQSVHQRIGHYVGHDPGWLKRIVRPLVNANLWIHTRSAFLSVNP